ncbi:hypothetical protein G9A89_021138 [Geosiphon pyriformis]|nr:hypothetical protein G9A89_021138 [Geosiphon pyriformis]
MQPTTNNQSSFNPLSIIAPGNGSIKGPTGDPDDGIFILKILFSYHPSKLCEKLSSGLLNYILQINIMQIWTFNIDI